MENDIVAIPRAQYQRWCRRLHNNERTLQDSIIGASSSSSLTLTNTEATANFRSVWCLPPELLLEILSYLSDQQSTLYSVALVCRQWFLCAIPILYKHAKIHNTYRWATFILTLGRDKRLFHYGSLAQSIDLSCDKDSEVLNTKDQETTQSSGATAAATAATVAALSSSHVPTTPLITTTTNNVTVLTATPTHYASEEPVELTAGTDNNARTTENGITYELYDILSEDDCHIAFHTTPSLVVSTSSLVQLAQACQNLVSIDLSYTHMFNDSMVAETGEYISTLQNYAIQPGLTHVKIPIETAINTIGQQCTQLEKVKIQCCGWVSARVIWLWVCSCPKLTYLDARRSSKCSVKRLTASILQVERKPQSQQQQQPSASSSSLSFSSSTSSSTSSPRSSLPPSSPPSASLSSSSISSISSSASDSTQSPKQWPIEETSNQPPLASSSSSATTGPSSRTIRHGESSRPSLVTRPDITEDEMMYDMESTGRRYRLQPRHVHNQRPNNRHELIFRHHTHRQSMDVDSNTDLTEEDDQWPNVDRHPLRRPPSPHFLQTPHSATNIPSVDAAYHLHTESSVTPLPSQSLRDHVWSILKDGKEQGLMELQWLED